jgi:ADP-heptose:LPS heptosyltransferase
MLTRRWLPQRFAEVADRLAASGIRIVLTGSPDEAEVVQAVHQAMRMPALNLCGKTDLGGLAALLAQARLVVSNDTGISHVAELAAALLAGTADHPSNMPDNTTETHP